jgi:tetratricopeptide (TPR) repeat protein
MSFLKNKNTRAVVMVMIALVGISIIVSKFYYSNVNKSVDPRVADARQLYTAYNQLAEKNEFLQIFSLLDSIETIYEAIPHYTNSFETAVLYNNRAAVYLTLALHKDSLNLPGDNFVFSTISKDSLLFLADTCIHKAIGMYEQWLDEYVSLEEEELRQHIEKEFLNGLQNYTKENQGNFLRKRIREILDAQSETKRRLSVSYTNLGIIYRHQGNYEEAIKSYLNALELWDQNLTAENNLNRLLGKPLKKRNFIQKLFPPKKD